MNISQFIKDHFSLCICTLGLAAVGYLGYRCVRYIVDLCFHTQKVEQVAQKNIGKNLGQVVGEQLVNRLAQIPVLEGKITQGHGEYVVFHKLPSGDHKELDKHTFEQVYAILDEQTPAAIVNRGGAAIGERLGNRFQTIQEKIKLVDPTLEVAFIPRTLYELIFIRKCIREDMRCGTVCPLTSQYAHQGQLQSNEKWVLRKGRELFNYLVPQKQKKCWHTCFFEDFGDNNDPRIKDVAFRLNRVIVKQLPQLVQGFTYQELSTLLEKEMTFLKAHHNTCADAFQKALVENHKIQEPFDCNHPGPTVNFGFELSKCNIAPMGVRGETDVQLIRDTMKLDCSALAQKAFFLFRGANYEKDAPYRWEDKNTAYSLSYGSSLYAGCIFDGGATAASYLRKDEGGYILAIPHKEMHRSPFYIPDKNTLVQLFSYGEIFHGRSKMWKGFDPLKLWGMNTAGGGNRREHLTSQLPKEEFLKQFTRYKSEAILLK